MGIKLSDSHVSDFYDLRIDNHRQGLTCAVLHFSVANRRFFFSLSDDNLSTSYRSCVFLQNQEF